MENNQNPHVDLSKTTPLETWSGHPVWLSGFILREMISQDPSESGNVIPVQVFFDPVSGKILDNLLPPSIQHEYSTPTSLSQPQPSQPESINWGDTQPQQPQWGNSEPQQPQQPQQPQWGNSEPQQPQQPQWGNSEPQQPQQPQQPQWGNSEPQQPQQPQWGNSEPQQPQQPQWGN